MKTSASLRLQYQAPVASRIATDVFSGAVVQPRLKSLTSSRRQPSIEIASTAAMAAGVLAHTPPSISGAPLDTACVGKYVGAAAVARATSTILFLWSSWSLG